MYLPPITEWQLPPIRTLLESHQSESLLSNNLAPMALPMDPPRAPGNLSQVTAMQLSGHHVGDPWVSTDERKRILQFGPKTSTTLVSAFSSTLPENSNQRDILTFISRNVEEWWTSSFSRCARIGENYYKHPLIALWVYFSEVKPNPNVLKEILTIVQMAMTQNDGYLPRTEGPENYTLLDFILLFHYQILFKPENTVLLGHMKEVVKAVMSSRSQIRPEQEITTEWLGQMISESRQEYFKGHFKNMCEIVDACFLSAAVGVQFSDRLDQLEKALRAYDSPFGTFPAALKDFVKRYLLLSDLYGSGPLFSVKVSEGGEANAQYARLLVHCCSRFKGQPDQDKSFRALKQWFESRVNLASTIKVDTRYHFETDYHQQTMNLSNLLVKSEGWLRKDCTKPLVNDLFGQPPVAPVPLDFDPDRCPLITNRTAPNDVRSKLMQYVTRNESAGIREYKISWGTYEHRPIVVDHPLMYLWFCYTLLKPLPNVLPELLALLANSQQTITRFRELDATWTMPTSTAPFYLLPADLSASPFLMVLKEAFEVFADPKYHPENVPTLSDEKVRCLTTNAQLLQRCRLSQQLKKQRINDELNVVVRDIWKQFFQPCSEALCSSEGKALRAKLEEIRGLVWQLKETGQTPEAWTMQQILCTLQRAERLSADKKILVNGVEINLETLPYNYAVAVWAILYGYASFKRLIPQDASPEIIDSVQRYVWDKMWFGVIGQNNLNQIWNISISKNGEVRRLTGTITQFLALANQSLNSREFICDYIFANGTRNY